MIEGDFVTFVKANTALTAIIAGQIYPRRAPEGAKRPYIVFHVISLADWRNTSGQDGVSDKRLQCDCWADDDATSRILANTLTTQMVHTTGDSSKFIRTQGGSFVYNVQRAGQRDIDTEPQVGKEFAPYGVAVDFLVTYT